MGSAVVKPLARRRGRKKVENTNDADDVSRQVNSMGNGNVNDNKVDLNIQQKKNITASLFSNNDGIGCFSFRSSRPVKFSKCQRKQPSFCEDVDSLYCNTEQAVDNQIHQNSPRSNQSTDYILPEIKSKTAKENPIRSNSRTPEVPVILPDIFSKQTQRSLNNIHKTTEYSFGTRNLKPATSQSVSGLNDITDEYNNPFYESIASVKNSENIDQALNNISTSTRDLKQYCLDRRRLIVKDIYEEAKLLSSANTNSIDITNKEITRCSEDSDSQQDNSVTDGRSILRERVRTPSSEYQNNESTQEISQYTMGSNNSLNVSKSRESNTHEEPHVNSHDKESCNSISKPDLQTQVENIDVKSEDESTNHKPEISSPEPEISSPKPEISSPKPAQEKKELTSMFAILQHRPQSNQTNSLPGRLAPIISPNRPGYELKSYHCDAEETSKSAAPVLCAGDTVDTATNVVDVSPNRKDRGDGNYTISSGQPETKNELFINTCEENKVSKTTEADTEVDEAIEEAAQQTLSKNNPANPDLTISSQTSSLGIISSKPPLPLLKESSHLDRRVQSAGCSRPKLEPCPLFSTFSKEDIKQQTFEEGLKPSATDGGVSFFVPVSDQGLKPQTSGVNIAERITKPKRPQLSHEEKMMMANINRQLQISKRKKFALKEIAKVKEALSATASSSDLNRTDRTRNCKVEDDDDELDREFGL